MSAVEMVPDLPPSPSLAFRESTAADAAYIYRTWEDSAGAVDLRTSHVSTAPSRYYAELRGRIAGYFAAGLHVEIAYDPHFPEVIVGYAAHRGPLLDWIYVRGALRRQGVARALLERLVEVRYHSRTSPLYVALQRAGVARTSLRLVES